MNPAIPLLRRARNEEGQAAALGGLLVFVAALSAMLVFTMGHRVREKVKVQSAADAAAFSLAVAEARAFNYFAFANRATVAHAVSVLSIESHQSYISFHEGLSFQAEKAFNKIEANLRKLCQQAKNYFARYPQCRRTSCHDVLPESCPPFNGCMAACEDIPNAQAAAALHDRAAKRLHDQWHKGWYHRAFMNAAEARFTAIDKLYTDEVAVFNKLKGQVGTGDSSIAQRVVREIDPALRLMATSQVAKRNQQYLEAAVALPSSGHSAPFANEWVEAVSGTRWPNWISARQINGLDGLENSKLWRETNRIANRGNETSHEALDINLRIRGGSGLIDNVRKDADALRTAIRPNSLDDVGGERGFAAYDGGKASSIVWYSWSVANFCSCRAEGYCPSTGNLNNFDAGVFATPNPNKGFHEFPDGMEIEEDLIGRCKDCFNTHTAYRGHPRFRMGNDLLANQPRTTVVVGKPWFERRANDQRPWEFRFDAALPTKLSFDTRGASPQRSPTQGYSVGIASALTYYHKPGGDGWREPPNLWNPYWRAKLHPVKHRDAAELLPGWARGGMGTGGLKAALNH